MKLTVNTQTLQTMVVKSMKGASCNKMIPLTSLMAIELKDNRLSLITTDATNYLYVSETKVEGDDFYVVVQADMFSKLISRLTCEKVKLELSDNFLKVKGNDAFDRVIDNMKKYEYKNVNFILKYIFLVIVLLL